MNIARTILRLDARCSSVFRPLMVLPPACQKRRDPSVFMVCCSHDRGRSGITYCGKYHSKSPGGSTHQSPGGSTSQSSGGSTHQSPGGSTSQSSGGSTSQSPGGSTPVLDLSFLDEEVDKRVGHGLVNVIVDIVSRQGHESLTMEQWDELFNHRLMPRRKHYLPLNLYMHVMETSHQVPLALVESLRRYIVERNIPHTKLLLDTLQMAVLSKYPGHESQIVKIYRDVRREHEVLDIDSIKYIVRGLSHTELWEECLELLDMYKLTARPGAKLYSHVIAGALRHHQVDTAFQLLDELTELQAATVDAVLKCDDENIVNRFLEYMSHRKWIPSRVDAEKIKDWFVSSRARVGRHVKCDAFLTKTSQTCPHCGTTVVGITPLTPSELTQLQDAFYARSIIKDDVYLSTTPEAITNFKRFLRARGPYDLVIDALNVAHMTKQNAPWRERIKLMTQVLDHFASQYLRILVLGKEFMSKSWPKQSIRYIESKADLYLAARHASEDDLFMLYAALHTPHTHFVTKDELRDHRHLLGDDLIPLFKRWQLQNQIVFRGPGLNQRLIFRMPNIHETSVQRTPAGWHIPYEDNAPREGFKPPHSWFCVRDDSSIRLTDRFCLRNDGKM